MVEGNLKKKKKGQKEINITGEAIVRRATTPRDEE